MSTPTESCYANGELLATYTNSGLHFALNDWLGDKRVQVSTTATSVSVDESCWNLPFNDFFGCSGSGTDATEHHYTGKEHDPYTGLDLFDARDLTNCSGRSLSPDWSTKPEDVPYADLEDPQSLDLYSYVKNNPLSHADKDGHCCDLVAPRFGTVGGGFEGAVLGGTGSADLGAGLETAIISATNNIFSSSSSSNAPAPATTGEPPQLAAGREVHQSEEVRPGEKAEVPTPSGAARMDRYDADKRYIREIKPGNARGQKSGQKQLDRCKA